MLVLAALNTKLHRPAPLIMKKSSEITKADHDKFQALPSDFCRAGCIYPQMEKNLCGTITIE